MQLLKDGIHNSESHIALHITAHVSDFPQLFVHMYILLRSPGDVIMLHCGHNFLAPYKQKRFTSAMTFSDL